MEWSARIVSRPLRKEDTQTSLCDEPSVVAHCTNATVSPPTAGVERRIAEEGDRRTGPADGFATSKAMLSWRGGEVHPTVEHDHMAEDVRSSIALIRIARNRRRLRRDEYREVLASRASFGVEQGLSFRQDGGGGLKVPPRERFRAERALDGGLARSIERGEARIRVECGGDIRVIGAERLQPGEPRTLEQGVASATLPLAASRNPSSKSAAAT